MNAPAEPGVSLIGKLTAEEAGTLGDIIAGPLLDEGRRQGYAAAVAELRGAYGAADDGIRYLLWDNERDMWWKANDRGYTRDPHEAGRYTQEAAVERALRASLGGLDHATVIVAEHSVKSA